MAIICMTHDMTRAAIRRTDGMEHKSAASHTSLEDPLPPPPPPLPPPPACHCSLFVQRAPPHAGLSSIESDAAVRASFSITSLIIFTRAFALRSLALFKLHSIQMEQEHSGKSRMGFCVAMKFSGETGREKRVCFHL
ncbi:hypothetical protein MHYP_G00087910 [Metynnis hypsauchen]